MSAIVRDLSVVENRPDTVGQQFMERVGASGDHEAFRFPKGDRWESVSWKEAGARVTRLAAGLVAAGIEEICLIVQPDDERFFEELLTRPTKIEQLNRLPQDVRDYEARLMDIGRRVTLVRQEVQDGFGHAVHCAREWVGNEPFLLLLGDHVYASSTDAPCATNSIDSVRL